MGICATTVGRSVIVKIVVAQLRAHMAIRKSNAKSVVAHLCAHTANRKRFAQIAVALRYARTANRKRFAQIAVALRYASMANASPAAKNVPVAHIRNMETVQFAAFTHGALVTFSFVVNTRESIHS